jgi:sulfur carrier protein ThiS
MSHPHLLAKLKQEHDIQLICLTPFRDEQWILDRFLSCALLWADMVILGDNNSSEPYEHILERHDRSRIRVVRVEMDGFNESAMRKPMLDAAREIPGKKLLVFPDTDEVLSANILNSPELHTLLSASPGTLMATNWFQLGTITTLGQNLYAYLTPFFMDDGLASYNMDKQFHGWRVPGEANEARWNVIKLSDINLVHYGHVNPQRTILKSFWYQCQEWLQPGRKTIMQILRQYYFNKEQAIHLYNKAPVPEAYFADYLAAGIDMTSVNKPWYIWQEKRVLEFFAEHGTARFDLLDIWNHDWAAAAKKYDMNIPALNSHKRSLRGKLLRWYVRNTANLFRHPIIRQIDALVVKVIS